MFTRLILHVYWARFEHGIESSGLYVSPHIFLHTSSDDIGLRGTKVKTKHLMQYKKTFNNTVVLINSVTILFCIDIIKQYSLNCEVGSNR